MMKIQRIVCTCLLGSVFFVAGCGDDSTVTGKDVKGPINGATVFYDLNDNGTLDSGEPSTTSLSDGSYTLPAGVSAKLVSIGGTYVDPATNAVRTAPTLTAPIGAKNVSPLTDLIAKTSAADVATVIASIEALGVKFDDVLITKTAANEAAMKLSESYGAVLATANAAQVTAIATEMLTILKTADSTKLAQIKADPASVLVNAAISTAATNNPTVVTQSFATTLTAAVTSVQTAIAAIAEGASLPQTTSTTPTTGTTGGSGGSGTTGVQ